ncbi:hypothetical protein A3D80_03330 [Candidatus Roizmanbacteria bacterium RIFCSPHIGHO2_02_FULL_40_13b]|uniref:TNase-like domain-containing protein n=1 Tax=Candidatus Roizmanbacteria bacterium RIFCSPHIGHO2_01_FULL_39_24 TaxID=1802032 RepID=A0A1F7GMN6_9BACT|nr:MAG: hypothetical protein A2799_01075 [Candidatus Roizmanbacteria bacterium RIFCSPHIGHO2_01_FULL_39_24]OGK26998.1 MAG: hypothetical protein A3D80_03330 [Candidatus Roizmanbacteria bacterium RIFCSPHIGHO2_02_FULL_40_13b]OGK48847.1 MAG: hypothetical protein A3A56_01395 [Candidatus Roizmanbacteria bacterium RIFCSPLOWO2_01_FULL_40_32]OGK57319.1 MAG: hypothetical protein A3H83_00580 [Candidatus Roizmanbacteria bacterium RIFCSPLOWO2_02_FULL_39_8]
MSSKQKLSFGIVTSVFLVLIISIFFSFFQESKQKKIHEGTVKSISVGEGFKPSQRPQINQTFLVTRIIDGDTFEIQTRQKVRLIGIDTPELNTSTKKVPGCFGIQAKEKLSELIFNKQVRLMKDISETDRYGRLLRYVYFGENFINQDLIEQGFALASTFPPDVKYKEVFLKAQTEARENMRGLWKECYLNRFPPSRE